MSNCCQLPIKLIDRRVDRRENNKTKRRAGWEKVNEQLKFVKFWASKTGILSEFTQQFIRKMELNHEPEGLHELVTAVTRIVTRKECKHAISPDRKFISSKQILAGKSRRLRQQHKGKQSHQ